MRYYHQNEYITPHYVAIRRTCVLFCLTWMWGWRQDNDSHLFTNVRSRHLWVWKKKQLNKNNTFHIHYTLTRQ